MISVYEKGKIVKVELTREEQSELARRNIEHLKHAEKKDVSDWTPSRHTTKKRATHGRKKVRQKEGKK